MSRTITHRKWRHWEPIASQTFAMDVDKGVIIRHVADMSMVFVPDVCVDDLAPWTEHTVCEDGDPDCEDPDCERHNSKES